MMRKFIKEICKNCIENEGFSQNFQKFYQLRQEPGWHSFVLMLQIIQGMMAAELLSDKFAEKTAEEKDIKQRTYANIRNFLEFLENPSLALNQAMFLWGNKSPQSNRTQRQPKAVPAGRR